MVDLKVLETSGVDHPAHLHEGFAVMKSGDPQSARALFAALGKDKGMTAPGTKPATKAAEVTPETAAAITKAVDAAVQPILDKIAESWKDLRAFAEKSDEETPSTEGVDPAAAAAAAGDPVLAAADLAKSADLPEPVRIALAKAAKVAKAAEDRAANAEAVAKAEQTRRLDNEAIALSKSRYTNMALDHDTVAPAIRQLGVISPELQKSVEAILVSANEQLDGADFAKELGTAARGGASGSAMAEVNKAAQTLVDTGVYDTIQKARGHVFEHDTDLAARVREETR